MQDQIEALTADSNGTDAQDSRAGSGTFLWRGRTFQVHSGMFWLVMGPCWTMLFFF